MIGLSSFEIKIEQTSQKIAAMLESKNRMYDNSVLNPVGVFCSLPVHDQIMIRLDDKFSRIQNIRDQESPAFLDALYDVAGYLTLGLVNRLHPGDAKNIVVVNQRVVEILRSVTTMLSEKNSTYGDSLTNPDRIVSRADRLASIRVRMDDKIRRMRARELGDDENPMEDLLGFLIVLLSERP